MDTATQKWSKGAMKAAVALQMATFSGTPAEEERQASQIISRETKDQELRSALSDLLDKDLNSSHEKNCDCELCLSIKRADALLGEV